MILTNEKTYNNVPASVVKEYRDKIAPYVNKRGINVIAQNKIAVSFAPLDAIVKDALARIAALNPETDAAAIAAIAAEKHTVTVYEIDGLKEWNVKSSPQGLIDLREAKMMTPIEPEPVEE